MSINQPPHEAAKTKKLGFGVGLRPQHYRYVTENWPATIDWFEIISENFMGVGGRPRRILDAVRERYPIVMHGVALSIGGTDPLSQEYLKKLKELADQIEPALISDHLCWTGRGGHNAHDLLPLPLTEPCLKHVAARLHQTQEYLGRRFLLENPSAYVGFADDALTEAEFLAELCQQTGCGLLLDLNNLYVNHCNLGLDPIAYLEALKPGMVEQFHLAGHMTERDAQGQVVVRIDTHDSLICQAVWDLYQLAVQRFPGVPTLIEWDDKIPDFHELQGECEKARTLALAAGARHGAVRLPGSWLGSYELKTKQQASAADLGQLQQAFLQAITKPRDAAASGLDLPCLRQSAPVARRTGARVYTDAYYLRLRDCLRETFPTLAFVCEEKGFGDLVRDYLLAHPPSHYSVKMLGNKLEGFIRSTAFTFDFGVDSSVLADIAALEWAETELFDAVVVAEPPLSVAILQQITAEKWPTMVFVFTPTMRLIETSCDAVAVIESVAVGDIPTKPAVQAMYYLLSRPKETVEKVSLTGSEFNILRRLVAGQTFERVCQEFQGSEGVATANLSNGAEVGPVVEKVLQVLVKAFAGELIVAVAG